MPQQSRTRQAEAIIYGLLEERQNLTLSEIKQALGSALRKLAGLAIWAMEKRGDLFVLGGGRYRGRRDVRARDRAGELYVMVKRFLNEPPGDELYFEAARLIARIER